MALTTLLELRQARIIKRFDSLMEERGMRRSTRPVRAVWIVWTSVWVLTFGSTVGLHGQLGVDRKAGVERLRAEVARSPNDAHAHFELGQALEDSGDSQGAMAEYRRGLQLSPDSLPARCHLAHILVSQSYLEEGYREYLRAVRQERKKVAEVAGLDRPPLLWEEFERAKPEAAARFLVGVILRTNGKPKQAVYQMRQAVRLDPKFALARLELGLLYGQAGNSERGRTVTEQAFQLNRKLESLRGGNVPAGAAESEWLIVALRNQELELRREALEQQLAIAEKVLVDGKRELAAEKNPARQEELKKRLADLEELVPALASYLAEIYYHKGQYDRAIETIQRALALRPDDEGYQRQLKKYEEALRATPSAPKAR